MGVYDVGDPARNAILAACFFAIVSLTAASIVPWKALGAVRVSRWARWIFLPVLLLAVAYEAAMPARFNIRVDLLLLLPMYGIVLAAAVVRWVFSRNVDRGRD